MAPAPPPLGCSHHQRFDRPSDASASSRHRPAGQQQLLILALWPGCSIARAGSSRLPQLFEVPGRRRWSSAPRPTVEFPKVRFHDLRHTHASALIASGIDVVAISRRLGHASPVVTLSVYAHLFTRWDEGAAAAIEAAMRTGAEQ
ncbi:tyrosine-type recombinase/integrase [Mesorhizobium kowhaii]|uniref:tyrosine-type recombinase/integrase n=1 Tax=Mesorhizobium kowhaii TaxID=1300272 RepID=UPI0035EC2699